MTGVELEKYLMDTGLFKDENVYMVETIDGKIYNRVPSYYKGYPASSFHGVGKVEIKIYCNKHGDGTKYVDFILAGVNLFGCYKLKELDFTTLHKELSKMFGLDRKFIEWSKIELRNYKINSLYEV
jgi:hypothetical protein